MSKVYVKLDENNCIVEINSDVFLKDTRGYILIDEGEGDRYTHAQNNYFDKPLVDENRNLNYIIEDKKARELSSQEKYNLFILPMKEMQERKEQEEQLNVMMLKAQQVSFLIALPDDEAVKIPLCYPAWETFIGKALKQNERIEYEGNLWKVRQDISVVLEHQPPSTETSSLYMRIDVVHDGTIDDPIPYDMNLEVFKDNYYIEDGVIYKCIRDSGQPLYATCKSLVEIYFEIVK